MGRDGAAGAGAVNAAGGLVIAQSADTAEDESMRQSAAEAAHLVLPLAEIAGVIADAIRGRPLRRPRSEAEAAATFFNGPG
jgi:chemotaxis response regulator CheB